MLLDTSVFLWFIAGDKRLPIAVRLAIKAKETDIFVSVISFWEITVKHSLGKLPLPQRPDLYIPKQVSRHGLTELPLSGAAVAQLGRLPAIHRDPFDRMLVCQALDLGVAIVTSDSQIGEYPVKIFWQ